MSEDAAFFPLGASDAPWYVWDQSAWYWAMGVFGVFWLALIVVAVVVILRTSHYEVPGIDHSAGSATRWPVGKTKTVTPLANNPSPRLSMDDPCGSRNRARN